MTELSRPWNGTTVGDSGPYTAPNWWDVWQAMLGGSGALMGAGNKGIFLNIGNALLVSYVGPNFLSVADGAALIDGLFYRNDAGKSVTVTSAGVGKVRDDRLVVRKTFGSGTQTARITLVAGSEVASPGPGTPPALVQDTSRLTYWDLPLARVSITDGGVITLTDERDYITGPSGAMVLIDTYEVTDPAGDASITFDNIPQTFADLIITYAANTTDTAVVGGMCFVINDDASAEHYSHSYRSWLKDTASFNYDEPFGDVAYMELGATFSMTGFPFRTDWYASGEIRFCNYAALEPHQAYGKGILPNTYHTLYEGWYNSTYAPATAMVGISKLVLYADTVPTAKKFGQGTIIRLYGTVK